MIKVLFDTCVIIDLLEKREPFFNDAHELLLAVANKKINGYLTAKSILDIYYIINHHTHNSDQTRNKISALFELFYVFDTGSADCQLALISNVTDYEDAVLVETAIRYNINCIVTRNKPDFKMSKMTVLAPKELIDLLNNEK